MHRTLSGSGLGLAGLAGRRPVPGATPARSGGDVTSGPCAPALSQSSRNRVGESGFRAEPGLLAPLWEQNPEQPPGEAPVPASRRAGSPRVFLSLFF